MSRAKEAAGVWAADQIQSGMRVGLGTGSTVAYFIDALIERCLGGLKIEAASSSIESLEKARAGGIPILEDFERLDLSVDGADEIDSKKRMIKGGGGALLREKILANASETMMVIVDESKCVKNLGGVKLPLEILPFGAKSIVKNIPYPGTFRGNGDYQTDNGNLIYDVHFDAPLDDPEKVHRELIDIPGVLETGFFFDLAKTVVIGKNDGKVEVIE